MEDESIYIEQLVPQLMNTCIHFTNVSDAACSQGMEYDAVKLHNNKPVTLPCFKKGIFAGGKHCPFVEFMNLDEARAEARKINSEVEKFLKRWGEK